ncbi:MAG: class GN sortase [Pseudomonadota bacterium]|nr:class GN sortase [Pseudomonadota bacterium]
MTFILILSSVALWNWASAGYIHLKARTAAHLLERAWGRMLRGEEDARPWPWADTRPVARLRAPRQGIDHIVLDGTNGGALAFAPGRMATPERDGEAGGAIIAGHRDTHFRFLRGVRKNDMLEVQGEGGEWRNFRVESMVIADSRHSALRLDAADRLVLVTCYPFDAVVPGGPLRYVVSAVPVETAEIPTRPDRPARN